MSNDYRYLIFAPKSIKDLRVQYPELMDYPEFKSHVIKMHDVMFVWWYACLCSPIIEKPDDERMAEAVHISYPSSQQRSAKLMEFRDRMPENIKGAIKRMESFNTEARVDNYLQTRTVRENCKTMLSEDTSTMDSDQKDAWATRAPKLWKLLDETTKTLERGSFGVSLYEETILDEADGTLRQFRQTKR